MKVTKSDELKLAEAKLEKKRKELVAAKIKHRKLAGDFIDLWMEVRKLKKDKY